MRKKEWTVTLADGSKVKVPQSEIVRRAARAGKAFDVWSGRVVFGDVVAEAGE